MGMLISWGLFLKGNTILTIPRVCAFPWPNSLPNYGFVNSHLPRASAAGLWRHLAGPPHCLPSNSLSRTSLKRPPPFCQQACIFVHLIIRHVFTTTLGGYSQELSADFYSSSDHLNFGPRSLCQEVEEQMLSCNSSLWYPRCTRCVWVPRETKQNKNKFLKKKIFFFFFGGGFEGGKWNGLVFSTPALEQNPNERGLER